jgi:hypothetical protein
VAYTTGTATDYVDLLDKLRQWMVGTCGWTQLAWAKGANPISTDVTTLSLRGPGSGAGREVYVNIKATPSPASSQYSWAISSAIGYQAAAAWGSQPGEGPPVYFNTWQNAITYWFYGNDRRLIVVAKCSTIYISAYAGLILPWSAPDQYPFPLYVGADFYQPSAYNSVNSARRMFCDPGASNAILAAGWCRNPDGVWNPVMNHQAANSNDWPWGYQRGSNYFIWPFVGANDTSDTNTWAYGAASGSNGGVGVLDRMVPTAQGDRIVLPVHLNHPRNPQLGVLDGVYMPLGAGIVAEQTVSAGGLTMRAFQNIHRNSANDIFLINEV